MCVVCTVPLRNKRPKIYGKYAYTFARMWYAYPRMCVCVCAYTLHMHMLITMYELAYYFSFFYSSLFFQWLVISSFRNRRFMQNRNGEKTFLLTFRPYRRMPKHRLSCKKVNKCSWRIL